MTYYVLETVTSLRLSIFYTITTCNVKANITLIAAPFLPQFLLLNAVRADSAVQATQKGCTSKNLQAKQPRSGDQLCTRKSKTTQHYMDLHRALCMTWKSRWKGWLSTKIGDGYLLKAAKKIPTVVKYSWLSNKFLSRWEAVLGKKRTEHKAVTLIWLVAAPLLSRQQVFVRMLSRPKDFTTNLEQTFAVLHEEVQICYKIKFSGLNWNCNERSWRSKLNGKH